MHRIVVYLKKDYSKAGSFLISEKASEEEIEAEVNKRYKEWYFYDIMSGLTITSS